MRGTRRETLWALSALTLAVLGTTLWRPGPPGAQTRAAEAQNPVPDTASLGVGRYSRMSMLLEKTLFKVDVLTLELRFGEETTRQLDELVGGQGGQGGQGGRGGAGGGSYSNELADSLAAIAIHSQDAWARIEFQRGVSLDQFVDGVREDLGRARDAGIISSADYELISEGIPRWFAFLEERRIQDGDEIFYRIRGDTLRTVFQGVEGELLLEQTDIGPERRLAVLGSYLAPKSSFRKGLIESLFRPDEVSDARS